MSVRTGLRKREEMQQCKELGEEISDQEQELLLDTKSIALGHSKGRMLGMLDDQRFTRSHRCKVTRKKVSTILMS